MCPCPFGRQQRGRSARQTQSYQSNSDLYMCQAKSSTQQAPLCRILKALNHRKILFIFSVLITAGIPLSPLPAKAGPSSLFARPVIAIDPGHGGSDPGVTGVGGLTEKAVTLALARTIRQLAGDRFQVFFTRTDDFTVSAPERADAVNTSDATLLVSLHTGGSFSQSAAPIRILHPNPADLPAAADAWSRGQNPFALQSRTLATAIAHAFAEGRVSKTTEILPADLLPLRAIAMPAVLVECGRLSAPSDERLLASKATMEAMAAAILDGIADFLVSQTPNGQALRPEKEEMLP